MAVKTLQSTDTLVFGQESDGFRALGIVASLAGLAEEYAKDTLFWFVERFRAGIEAGTYGILYERADAESPLLVPVGFLFWGNLSRASGELFKMRLRALNAAELNSGPNLWVIDICAQYGHFEDLKALFELHYSTTASYKATRWQNGELVLKTYTNAVHAKQAAAAQGS